MPSARDGSANTSSARITSGTSARSPASHTRVFQADGAADLGLERRAAAGPSPASSRRSLPRRRLAREREGAHQGERILHRLLPPDRADDHRPGVAKPSGRPARLPQPGRPMDGSAARPHIADAR